MKLFKKSSKSAEYVSLPNKSSASISQKSTSTKALTSSFQTKPSTNIETHAKTSTAANLHAETAAAPQTEIPANTKSPKPPSRTKKTKKLKLHHRPSKTPTPPTPPNPAKARRRHLRLEIAIVAAVVIAVIAIRFFPWLLAQPVSYPEPYLEYQKLYNDVSAYDYSRGRDAAMERRIDAALSTDNGSDLVQYYYNLKAKGEYYQRTGRYSIAIAAFEEALPQAPLMDEYEYLYTALVKCYRAIGDYASATKYQSILDGTYEVEEYEGDTENIEDIEGVEYIENE